MQFFNLLLGLFVLVLYELLYELAGLVPEVVVADVHLYLAVVYVHDVRADVVEEVAVVADHEDGTLVVHEEVLEPDDALEVEVVRGLVEQDDVRLAEERLGEQDLDLEPRVHVCHERVVEGGVHAEALEYLAGVGLGLPAAELCELLLELGGADAVLVREVCLFVDGILLLAALIEPHVAHDDSVEHGVGVVHALVLLEHGHAGLRVHIDVSAGGVYLAGEYLEEGGFARAVRADDAVAVACGELQVNVGKKHLPAVLQAEIINSYHVGTSRIRRFLSSIPQQRPRNQVGMNRFT